MEYDIWTPRPGHTWSSSRFTFRRETRYILSEMLKGSGHAPPPPVVCSTVLPLSVCRIICDGQGLTGA